MDGASGFFASARKGFALISQHLQIPTLLLIAPLLIWGIWLISESSYDTWGSLIHSKYIHSSKEAARDSRSQSIFLNCAIGLSLLLLSYFFIFINPRLVAPTVGIAATIAAFLAYANGQLERERSREKAEFEAELPTYMQLMTVLISSGVSPARAMDLLSRNSHSISGECFREVVDEIRNGLSVVQALDNLSRKYESLILRRFATGVILAVERGSSLTPMLIAQVKDARVAHKNEILQRAGRAEISLMIPVVFLILPISILFALWPSYQQLGSFI